ncbi:MAG TPA: BlaI/MecI/CopY family transcriptional regulator [Ktedonobacteraceae bacterium]|nr:BlaI/MecI/CopY family transcriptional regulator [Ktedonobacteraceae bacterium]
MNNDEPNVDFAFDISTFRPDRPGIRKVLGDLEAEIMELVWERPPQQGIAVREIFELLHARRRIAYTTVMNTMTRLAKKNLLHCEKKDIAYIYYPNFTQQAFVARFVSLILEDLFVSFSGATLEGIRQIHNPQAAASARQLFEEVSRRRQDEEGE